MANVGERRGQRGVQIEMARTVGGGLVGIVVGGAALRYVGFGENALGDALYI